MKRRMFIMLVLISSIVLFIGGRLFWIQILTATRFASRNVDLVSQSVKQREQTIELNSGRGVIVDKNEIPLTGKWVKALVITPLEQHFRGNNAEWTKLSSIIGTSAEQWQQRMNSLNHPDFWRQAGEKEPMALSNSQAAAITALKLPNVQVMPYFQRYREDQTAEHVIGYIGQNPQRTKLMYADQIKKGEMQPTAIIGAAGLEKTFEAYLRGVGDTSVSFFTDAKKRPLSGLQMRLVRPDSPYYPLQLVTTLDSTLQQRIEAYLEREHVHEGAVVVLDASNANIVSMASRPQFNPNRIDLSNNNWGNHALKAVTPGSIFKTVIAVAALEEHVVDLDEHFECDGELGKYGLSCWLKGGHGSITIEEAYAESCNVTFAKIAARLTAEQIEKYARALGLHQTIGWEGLSTLDGSLLKQLDSEEAGQVFTTLANGNDGGIKAQSAIGQRDVLVSPLQAASMVVTLLNNGKLQAPKVVERVNYANGDTMTQFKGKSISTEVTISAQTSKLITKWMQKVVEDGTGKSLQSAKWKLAGKSGTAEILKQGRKLNNQWFIGYGPVDNPRYAVSVVVENTNGSKGHQATKVFKGVLDIIASYGL